MRVHRVLLGVCLACVPAGCSENSTIVSPPAVPAPAAGPTRMLASDGYEAPTYQTMAEVPEDIPLARLISYSSRVGWSGATASGFASMEGTANRIDQTLNLSIIHDYQTVGSVQVTAHEGAFWGGRLVMGTPIEYTVARTCGQVANLNTFHSARVVVFVEAGLVTLSQAGADSHDGKPQAACASNPCGSVTQVSYDPYSSETGCEAEDDGGSTGTQYQLGDHTGGETVGFGTGMGDGGSSSCGQEAVVEYVCIDVYDEETGTWDEWACGYATTC
jgi:hypothetical protein